MMGRFGAVELFNMRVAEFHMENKKEKACEQLFTCAGFFPNDTSLLPRFNDIMKDACRQTDILGLWQNACEDYYIRRYCNDLSATCRLISLEPWRSKNPWSAALAEKRYLLFIRLKSRSRISINILTNSSHARISCRSSN